MLSTILMLISGQKKRSQIWLDESVINDVEIVSKKVKIETIECEICVDNINIDKLFECQNCTKKACLNCISKYIFENQRYPECMFCKKMYDMNYLRKKASTRFIDKVRNYIAKIEIFDEKKLLPQTQYLAEVTKKKEIISEKITLLENSIIEFRSKHNKMIEDFVIKQNIVIENLHVKKELLDNEKNLRKMSIIRCGTENCRGFLNESFHCGLCETKFCVKCVEAIDDIEHHVCDKSLVASNEMIKNTTKQCPECGVKIDRNGGCKHMFCTICNIGFCWETGREIDLNENTNPHFFQWREIETGVDFVIYDTIIATAVDQRPDINIKVGTNDMGVYQYISLREFGKRINYILSVDFDTLSEFRYDKVKEELRVDYLLNKITEKKWITLLKQNKKKEEFVIETLVVLKEFMRLVMDILKDLVNGNENGLKNLRQIRCKANSQFVSNTMSLCDVKNIPNINEEWRFLYKI